jgi:hypothetical protein
MEKRIEVVLFEVLVGYASMERDLNDLPNLSSFRSYLLHPDKVGLFYSFLFLEIWGDFSWLMYN